ncbi:pentatricopeptide repeat-containing protein At2g17033 [Actinidia eriantha]|uniref:pentatricopeptide repeat-containing protein At2g17033 n=1 Tax=Actinidia eriantha TaxID=165200 RepID=UPI00258E5EB4|nr:pentatricopeptide repeat-containing protein At2g17033 [Actinidia eriantha]XP_057494831.1 pentatricopeptide repeat-containing protein At2g17033 [Actinidia eriantha]
MVSCVKLSIQLPCNHRREPPPTFTIRCALSKQAHRFLTSLATTAVTDDPSVSTRQIRKFVHSSSKSIALNALSHLLCPDTSHPHLSSLAFPLYSRISEASWFNWNPKLVADLVALLDKLGQLDNAKTLISEAEFKLGFRKRDLALFYCNLIDSHSKHKAKTGFFDSYSCLKQLMRASSSVYVKRRACEAMVGGLCAMDLPQEAENLMEEMRGLALKPSVFEFRSVIYAYGRLGLFVDMKRCVVEMEIQGFELDTVCSNMVLSSFGAHGELSEMVQWLQKIRNSGVAFSIRTYNSVLNSCPTIMTMLQDLKCVPISMRDLMENLPGHEGLLVQELIGSSVLENAIEWNSLEGKLDLHGMHLGCAYLIVLQWIEELRSRFKDNNQVIPAEVTVVCGAGKHSTVRRESPVKCLVKQMMVRMTCPMRIDRHNVGCFVAKGKVLKGWLS